MQTRGKFFDLSMLRFAAVGLINTAVGSAIQFGLYNLGHCSYWFSTAANYTLTSILSFFLNRRFTFRSRGRASAQAPRFALNILVCYLVSYKLAKVLVLKLLSGCTQTVAENIAMLTGMAFFTCLNYLGQRFFAFRERRSRRGEDGI